MSTTTILHLIDSLAPGGAERMAVNIANALSQENYRVILCATRKRGELEHDLFSNVKFICLNRKFRFDVRAILGLIKEIEREKVNIVHAHSSSVFLAVIAKILRPKLKVIWHIHAGAFSKNNRTHKYYRVVAPKWDAVITVTKYLKTWAEKELRIPNEQIWFLPNFVRRLSVVTREKLPGENGFRIICVANIRPEKDHFTLLRAMESVIRIEDRVHLFLVGAYSFPKYHDAVCAEIERRQLTKKVTLMGPVNNVQSILNNFDLGILSSTSEGFPLALLEYGIQGLPVVCTRVGECPNILDNGLGGILVEPGDSNEMAEAIVEMINNEILRNQLRTHLYKKISSIYSQETVLSNLKEIYQSVLN